jgi:DNA-binding NtrC family response regulator
MDTVKKAPLFVVDDDMICLEMTRQLLEMQGCTDVRVFTTTADFLNNLTEEPLAVFLDYNMDNLNGIEVLKKIKRFNPDIFVVMVSGQDNITIAVNSLKYGAFDYIVKSDITEELLGRVLIKISQTQEIIERRNRKNLLAKVRASLSFS